MKLTSSFLVGALFLAGASTALGGSDCQKCTHDFEVQYRACRQSGKDQETCTAQEQAAAQVCVKICQKNKAPDEK
ncbi:MAG TPA: hypothetical protein VGN99_06550 [Steroidobacteraceae bacterium]|jgi:hypothetical protein|nr:hypothetical protein [Steroidobacteraceae bacterium]